jgi:hypothetical protein
MAKVGISLSGELRQTAPMFVCASQIPECLRYNEIKSEFREYGCTDSKTHVSFFVAGESHPCSTGGVGDDQDPRRREIEWEIARPTRRSQ